MKRPDDKGELFKLISVLLQYPTDLSQVRQAARQLNGIIREDEGLKVPGELMVKLDGFLQFIENSQLWKLQEEYVSTFDLFPLCPPYVSHHLYGESYKKGEYMVRLREIYREYGFEVPDNLKNELPDHISVIMGFLGEIGKTARQEFLNLVLDGLKKMAESVKNKDTPFGVLITLAYLLCFLESRDDAGWEEWEEVMDFVNGIEDGEVIKC